MKELAALCVLLVMGYTHGRELSEEIVLERDQSKQFQSVNYPQDTEADLKQEWTIKTDPSLTIRLFCEDFRLFEMIPCGPYRVTFKEESGEEEMCGVHFGYERFSTGGSLTVTLWTGQWDRGFLKCTATALSSIPPPPPPTRSPSEIWAFRNDTYEPIDSTEHGGPEGIKHVQCRCGWANKEVKRIYGGAETGINEFPFVASIHHGDSKSQFCGGSILTHRHVLTAAHCTDGEKNKLYVSVADHNLLDESSTPFKKTIGVEKIIIHSDYNPTNLLNDISMLVLDEPIEFNDYTGPICLLNKAVDLAGQYVKIIGWGRTPVHRWGSPVLQKVDVKVLPKDTCHDIIPMWVPKGSPTQLCTWAPGKGSCSGDSGGPLAWVDPETNRYTLIGLVSYGVDECGSQTPRYSTDVFAFNDWIQDQIKETDATENTCSKLE